LKFKDNKIRNPEVTMEVYLSLQIVFLLLEERTNLLSNKEELLRKKILRLQWELPPDQDFSLSFYPF
jgi:hypothetical protein